MEFFWQKRIDNYNADLSKSTTKSEESSSKSSSDKSVFSSYKFDRNNLEDDLWENITSFNEVGRKVFYFDNGLRITSAEDSDDIVVTRNKETGEVIVFGGKEVSVDGSDEADIISFIDSNIALVDTADGNDTIYVENSTGYYINSASGKDEIYLKESEIEFLSSGESEDKIVVNSSEVGTIASLSGNDSIYLNDSKILDVLNAGSEDDYLSILNSKVSNISTEGGNDDILIDSSSVSEVDSGKDDDRIVLKNSQNQTVINSNKGSDVINVVNSTGVVANGEAGKDSFIIKNSDVVTDVQENESIYTQNSVDYVQYVINQGEEVQELAQNVANQKISSVTDRELTPEEQMQALTLSSLQTSFQNMSSQYQDQLDEDGIIRDGYNLMKQLLDFGVSREDIELALAEQEQMISELEAAFNGESEYTFEEVFEKWTGVPYSEDAITEYMESENIYSLAVVGMQKVQAFTTKVQNAETMEDVLQLYIQYYGDEQLGREKLNEFLNSTLTTGMVSTGLEEVVITENFEMVRQFEQIEGLSSALPSDSDTHSDLSAVPNLFNFYRLDSSAFDIYQQEFKDSFEQSMGYSIEQAQSNYAINQLNALGSGNAIQRLVDRYCAEQEGFIDKISTGAQIAGISLMLVGGVLTVVYPPASLGVMQAGKWLSVAGTFGDNALEFVDEVSTWNLENFSPEKIKHFKEISQNYDELYTTLTEEEKKEYDSYIKQCNDLNEIFKETVVDALLYFSGKGINTISSSVHTEVAKHYNEVLAYLADIGVDSTLSLLSDLMITGEIDLTSEGISQILGLISGLSGEKLNRYTKQVLNDVSIEYARSGDAYSTLKHLADFGFSSNLIIDYSKSLGFEISKSDVSAIRNGQIPNILNLNVSKVDAGAVTTPINSDIETQQTQKDTTLFPSKKSTVIGDEDLSLDTNSSSIDVSQNRTRLAESGFPENVINAAMDLEQEHIETLISYRNSGFTLEQSIDALDFSPEKKSLILKLKELGYSADECFSSRFEDDQILKNTILLAEAGLSPSYIKVNATLPPEKIEKLMSLLDNGFSARFATQATNLPSDVISRYVKLLENGFDEKSCASLYRQVCSDEQLDVAISLRDGGFSPFAALYISTATSDVDLAFKLSDAGFDEFSIRDMAKMSPEQIDIALMLKGAGLTDYDIFNNVHLTQEQASLYIRFKSAIAGKNFDALEMDYLTENYLKSPYYSPEEFVETFEYFKNITTPDGKRVFSSERLYEKFDEVSGEKSDINSLSSKKFIENIKQLMNIDPSSVEASYLQTMIELVESGAINGSALRVFETADDFLSNKSIDSQDGRWHFSEGVCSDIEMLYDVISRNTDKTKLQQELADAFTPTVKTEADGLASTIVGNTFQLEGEDFIRIKTSETTSEQLNMSKDTYYKLFPPIDRFASSQQVFGDCYCIETFMSLYGLTQSRADVLKLFSETEDGNVVVDFPNGSVSVNFESGKLPTSENPEYYASGADGFKLLEYAFSVNLMEDRIMIAQKSMTGEELAEFVSFLEQNKENIFISQDENGFYSYMTYDEAVENGSYREELNSIAYPSYKNYLLGNGGQELMVLNKMGYSFQCCLPRQICENLTFEEFSEGIQADVDDIRSLFGIDVTEDNFSFDYMSIADSIKNDPLFFEQNSVHVGFNEHAYSLSSSVDELGQRVYYLYNPHVQALPILIKNIDEFLFDENLQLCFTIGSKK